MEAWQLASVNLTHTTQGPNPVHPPDLTLQISTDLRHGGAVIPRILVGEPQGQDGQKVTFPKSSDDLSLTTEDLTMQKDLL